MAFGAVLYMECFRSDLFAWFYGKLFFEETQGN